MKYKDLYERLNGEFDFDFEPKDVSGEWGHRNFVHPPYNLKEKESFIKKSVEEAKLFKLCVLLLPVSTSTKIFHDYIFCYKQGIITQLRFLKGRLKFRGNKTPFFDSMVVIFDGRPR